MVEKEWPGSPRKVKTKDTAWGPAVGTLCLLPSGLTVVLQGGCHHLPSQMQSLDTSRGQNLPSTMQLEAGSGICSQACPLVYTLHDSAAGREPYSHFCLTELPNNEILGSTSSIDSTSKCVLFEVFLLSITQ